MKPRAVSSYPADPVVLRAKAVVAEIEADVVKALRRRALQRRLLALILAWPLGGYGWKWDLGLALATTGAFVLAAREWGWLVAALALAFAALEVFLALAVLAGLVAGSLKDHE